MGDYGRGGGSIAMYRLHRGLRAAGVDSKILCKYKKLESSESVTIPHSFLSARLEPRLGQLTSLFGLNDIHCLSTFKIQGLRAYREADLLDFHGIHSGFFNYLALPSLTAHKPAVFTLHDMWPLTGHCMYSYDCERWKIGCGQCPYPDSYPPVRRDNTRLEWKLKRWVYKRSHITITTPSAWLAALAKHSMLGDLPIHHIPMGVDTDVYQPLDRGHCRSLLGIPVDKRVLLFAAMRMNVSSFEGFRKGGDLLIKALQGLPEALKAETVLLLFGEGGEAIAEAAGIQAINLGYVSSDRLKAIAYCAADLFVLPLVPIFWGLSFWRAWPVVLLWFPSGWVGCRRLSAQASPAIWPSPKMRTISVMVLSNYLRTKPCARRWVSSAAPLPYKNIRWNYTYNAIWRCIARCWLRHSPRCLTLPRWRCRNGCVEARATGAEPSNGLLLDAGVLRVLVPPCTAME